jgi:hypothetical protein
VDGEMLSSEKRDWGRRGRGSVRVEDHLRRWDLHLHHVLLLRLLSLRV